MLPEVEVRSELALYPVLEALRLPLLTILMIRNTLLHLLRHHFRPWQDLGQDHRQANLDNYQLRNNTTKKFVKLLATLYNLREMKKK